MTEYTVVKVGDKFAVAADDQLIIIFDSRERAEDLISQVLADDLTFLADDPRLFTLSRPMASSGES